MIAAVLDACAAGGCDRNRTDEELRRACTAAAAVLGERGVSGIAVRACGWSNLVWLVGDVVLRIAAEPDGGAMERESKLVAQLPPGVGHPKLLASGEHSGFGWQLTERVDAVSLADVWDALDAPQRARAIAQTWVRAELIHRSDLDPPATSPFFSHSDRYLAELVAAGVLERGLHDQIEPWLRLWRGACASTAGPCHGDLHGSNVLWAGTDVVGLVDLEFAVAMPPEADLQPLARFVLAPDEVRTDPASLAEVEALRNIAFAPEVLVAAAVAFELFGLDRWARWWDRAKPYTDMGPHRRLVGLLGPDRGYLAPLVGGR